MRKFLFMFFSVAIFSFLAPTFTQASTTFPDVTALHRNFDAINYVKNVGIVDGYPDGNFRPYKSINRAEYTKILVEAQFSDSVIDNCVTAEVSQKTHPYFSDVESGVWFEKYLCVAIQNGLIGGYPDGTFQPSNTINFVESAKILVTAFDPEVKDTDNDEWFAKYVLELADEKRAVPGTITDFNKNMERGEVAEMIHRVKEDITDKESPQFSDLKCADGDVHIPDNTTVDRICVKIGNVFVGNNVDVVHDIVVLKGDITIEANSTIGEGIRTIEEGSLFVDSNADIGGTIMIERGNLILGSNPTVGGDIRVLQGNIDLRSNIDVKGSVVAIRGYVDLASNATVGAIEARDNVTIGVNAEVDSILSIDGDVVLGGNVDVAGDVSAEKGTVTFGANAEVAGEVKAQKEIKNEDEGSENLDDLGGLDELDELDELDDLDDLDDFDDFE